MILFKRIIVFTILSFYVGIIMANSEKALVIQLLDGSSMTFSLSNTEELSFEDRKLWIYTTLDQNGVDVEIPNVKLCYFADVSSLNGILDVVEERIKIYNCANERIVIEGIEKDDLINIYSLDGKLQSNCVNLVEDKVEVQLCTLSSGVYIINISNKQSFKVYKR